ncbi:Imm71 family immunity protein [Xanthomonas hortorum]|uniref:Imm71 family immunity protein n=1 Tax=Xanthomonas hortorum TaxID=56454 RepID=UPI001F447039|nr:Imm71 family immunity protein [Xanthomonas hortorum]MCE4364436.1 immunity 71 family protein [Xanthomonas hortorum]
MSNNFPEGLKLPNELERRQMFYQLKKESSFTAWNRMFEVYQAWANVTEESVRQADAKGWLDKSGISESDYVCILKGLAHQEEGVRRLRKGDKRVFKFDANGEFVMGHRIVSHFIQLIWRIEIGENAIKEEFTPRWDEFRARLSDIATLRREIWGDIIEGRYFEDPAPNIYGRWFQENVSKMHFPPVIPDVPDPVENTLVATGSRIPCSGIWEPVDAPKPKKFSLFSKPDVPSGFLPYIAAMNYLHGGSAAPKARQETQTGSAYPDVVWRLIWRDDRYEDGTIPEEEAGYVFMQPDDRAAIVAASDQPQRRQVSAMSGQRASQAGRWLVMDDLNAAGEFNEGDELPLHQGRKVQWVLADQ